MKAVSTPGIAKEIEVRRRRVRTGRGWRLYPHDEDEELRSAIAAELARQDQSDAEQAAANVRCEIGECERLIFDVVNGELSPIGQSLKRLRDERIAHSQIEPPGDRPESARAARLGDEGILLDATIAIVEKLNMLVHDRYIDMASFANIWDQYATYFWTPVRAETSDEVRAARAYDRARRE